MTDFDALPDGWTVWNESEERCVLVYRPDVFDSHEFPAPCLPTIYLTHGRRSRRPGTDRRSTTGDSWYVTLYLEPDVDRDADRFADHEAAVAGAIDLAKRFADGAIDYRGLYQVPREEYFEKLDELTGHE
ncbi:DUF5820 family protein [Halococcus saccharolyticus]|uniref:Uncharacterized protein n=1 Tax=Halococcus saccharolyticus DSM 5350 TaxID=1227455 RepID=M0MM22_9EURY|nr:DUF5820 family protein [Halococcus saccharolyticus]EMA45784.1 hypothetical protein C449_05961 [Halococcus saccharolyticus DSM 5350]